MRTRSRSLGRLGLVLGCAAATATVADRSLAQGPARLTSPFFSRWTVSEDRPVFSARGKSFKTVDIAPCGRDFCGVSVSDAGVCGPVLFRFLARHASGEDVLRGHGRWGDAVKNVQVFWSEESEDGDHRVLEIFLGDGHEFGGRSESMPTFHSTYRRAGGPRCKAT